MANLKRTLFWNVIYLLVIVFLGQLDRSSTPIINFAVFFYLLAIFIIPIMIFVPSLHKVSVVVPMFFWGATYLIVMQVVDRSKTGSMNIEVIGLELTLLEIGVWLSYQLSVVIQGSESLMEVLAQGTFPYRATNFDQASDRIKNEFAKSRRYHRPLALVVISPHHNKEESQGAGRRNLQSDMMRHLSNARIGQIVGEEIRQTDFLIKDHFGRYMILCPETTSENAGILSARITRILKTEIGVTAQCGYASFPEEALTFDDLVDLARNRIKSAESVARDEILEAASRS